MSMSPTIGKLAGALSKAQGSISTALKNKENLFLKSSYSTLTAVWDACRDALVANELSVVQNPQFEGTQLVLETILMHSSGEFIISKLPLSPKDKTSQAQGSAITYARRYALASMVGICPHENSPEEDDGNYNSSIGNSHVRRSIQSPISINTPEITRPIPILTGKALEIKFFDMFIQLDKKEISNILAKARDREKTMTQAIERPEAFITYFTEIQDKKKEDEKAKAQLEADIKNEVPSKTSEEIRKAMKEGKI